MSEQYRPTGFRLLPTVVKNLLIINGLMYLLQLVSERTLGLRLEDYLGLHYFGSQAFKPWQLVTYMFLHGSIAHVAFNMFALWMFGYLLENVWGPKRFLLFYLVTGIGAAITHYVVFYFQIRPEMDALNAVISDPNAAAIFSYLRQHPLQISPYSGEMYSEYMKIRDSFDLLASNTGDRQALQTVVNFLVDYKEYFLSLPNVIGASGAVFGILLAFGMMFPNMLIYIYFLFPIKAKYFVILYGGLEIYLGFSGGQPNVAHFAHLGGMIFGFFLIWYWKKKGTLYS